MRGYRSFLLLTVLLLSACTVKIYGSYHDLYTKVRKQTVQLISIGGAPACTGVIVHKNYVLSADHCIKLGAPIKWIRFHNGVDKEFTVVKDGNYESSPDLILLHVDTMNLPKSFIGSMPKVGDVVASMGSPFRLGPSFTIGVVNALNVRLVDSFTGQDYGVFMEHDARTNPGSSGGGVFDINGKLVGINARGGSGISFAVPVDQIKEFLKDAIPEKR